MPRFTLRNAFWCTTLIAIGAAEIGGLLRTADEFGLFNWLMVWSGGMIGSGIGVLFERPRRGFVVGCLIGIIMLDLGIVASLKAHT